MKRRDFLLAAATAVVATPQLGSIANAATMRTATPAPPRKPAYYVGDYTPSLEMYSFNLNLNAAIKGKKGTPPITLPDAITWAASVGFKAVDITCYYLPGYDTHTMPTVPTPQIMAYAGQIRAQCQQLGLAISGTGAFNDFADPNAARVALDIQRVQFWTDVAAAMGAPVMRVFSGVVPADINQFGWAAITQNRIVPALRQVTEYAATKGVRIVLQNHGDMTATADQTIQMLTWVDHPNISIIDDTGYFRPFQAANGFGYNWYPDIAKVLPYSASIQLKKEPAGEGTLIPMDLNRVLTDLRLADYRDFIPLELLWVPGEVGYPKDLTIPPFDQISTFQGKVEAAIAQTRVPPFDAVRQSLAGFAESGDVAGPVRDHLYDLVRQADDHLRDQHGDQSIPRMRDFIALVAAPGPSSAISATAAQALTQQMNTYLLSFTDVFG
ncbi:MAG TPA: sugar phosphate isomerase/epimerase family protein [Pseudonocardiaceae bacterium]